MRYLPPSKINCCDFTRALLSEGCIVSGHRILHSVIGVRSRIGEGSVLEHTVMMGADYFEGQKEDASGVPLGVGKACFIRNAITVPATQVSHANRLKLKVCVPAGLLRWWRLFVQDHIPRRKRGERPVEDLAPPPSD